MEVGRLDGFGGSEGRGGGWRSGGWKVGGWEGRNKGWVEAGLEGSEAGGLQKWRLKVGEGQRREVGGGWKVEGSGWEGWSWKVGGLWGRAGRLERAEGWGGRLEGSGTKHLDKQSRVAK